MANPIAESTRVHLLELTADERAAAEAGVRGGVEGLELEQALDLFKAVKIVASVDGMSREELGGLKFSMIIAGLPRPQQQHVLAFEAGGVAVDHVAELFPPGSRLAAYVLSGATTVAAIDGLSADEQAWCRDLGAKLELDPKLVDILIAEARATGRAMHEGNQALVVELIKLRKAIHALVDE